MPRLYLENPQILFVLSGIPPIIRRIFWGVRFPRCENIPN